MADPVILTGATGFVGRAVLAELVTHGIPIHAVSRKDGPALDGVIWHRADLLTPEGRAAVAGLAPRMIHCAWDVAHGLFWTSPANALWQAASVDLVHRFRAAGGQRLLVLGTCAEYDAQARGPWDENRPIAPATPYGQTKAALHRQLSDICGDHLIWARLFHLYGPGEDRRRLIPSLIDRLSSGQTAEVRAAGLVRDYASTAHVARCLVALLQTGATGAFDIGAGMPRSLGDLARVIASAIGAGDRLILGDAPAANDPAIMAPDLAKLWTATGLTCETPERALRQLIRSRTNTQTNTLGTDPKTTRSDPRMSFFKDYFATTDERVLTKWAHYYDVYERELARFRQKPISFLEIGVFKGGSVPMWKAFLPEGSRLTFIDIDPACAAQEIPGTNIVIGSQADPAFLAELAATYGPFDLVIDDGSHINRHQIITFKALWPHMTDGGLYVVEDCHSSYWPGFGGGYRNEASFIEFSKRLIDRMHSWYTDQDELFPFDPIAKELDSVRFFDSIVMLEKRIKTRPPTLHIIQNGKIEESTRPLKIRGRRSVFDGKDGA